MFPLKREVQITVAGKVYRANRSKILALNRCLEEYFDLVKWYLRFSSTSKTYLHSCCYGEAKRRFNLNTALIQSARDKAVEMLESFIELKKQGRAKKDRPEPERVSIRFDRRSYSFSKASTALTPYWLTLSLRRGRKERISLPIVFGERQRKLIEEALNGEWEFAAVEMVKRDGEWYAHFVLKKTVEVPDDFEIAIGIDVGERNLAVAVAISKNNPNKPLKGRFWKGAEIKRIRGLYAHIRRKLQRKKLLKKVKELRDRERRKVNQQLHIIANEVIAYAKQFPKPIIVMEDLTGIRDSFDKGEKLNRRFHTLPFRKLQKIIEYKALLNGINVVYVDPQYTSKECHRCGHAAQEYKREIRCPKCKLIYNRDLNGAINIARTIIIVRDGGAVTPPNRQMRPRVQSPG